jgi:PTS system nitrogen regulatory IIA component
MAMDLKIKDVADLLNISETTVRRWLGEGKIPAYRISQQYRFNRAEIEDWVILHKQGKINTFTPDKNGESEKGVSGSKQFSLYRAIYKGQVLSGIPGKTKEDVIRATMKKIAPEMHLDADVLTELLLDRERLQPTALNNGLGIPHTRDFLLSSPNDVVTVAFPDRPLEYGALDGKPVHTLFFLFAANDKKHLHLLAKIAHLSSQPKAVSLLQSKPNREQLLSFIKDWESSMQPK